MPRIRVESPLALVCITVATVAVAGCTGGTDRPARLVDGTRAQPPPVELHGTASPQLETRATKVDLRRIRAGSSVAACLTRTDRRVPRPPVVLRTGVHGTSITFATAAGRDVFACDATRPGGPWCGRALGLRRARRLVDPRLDLAACVLRDRPVAFVWIEPGRGTRYVAVRQGGFAEVYPILGDLPVRIATTTGIDLSTSSASFEISEHDGSGRKLRTYTLEARVAG